ncbi:protein MpGID1L4 [Marchantia polymorpha subsp. ruderalis]
MASEGIANDHSSVWRFHDQTPWPTGSSSGLVPEADHDLTESYHGVKNFVVHPDFSVTRPPFELVAPNSEFVNEVACKDVTIDEEIDLWVRIYVPETVKSSAKKLPVILFFHGGGFVCLSPHARLIHDYCESVCRSTDSLLVSVNYRKAPDYRIPTQYEDAFTALNFLRSQARLQRELEEIGSSAADSRPEALQLNLGGDAKSSEPWLRSHADFDRCYYMGDSAGGNLVHHLSVRALSEDLRPLRVRGQILVQPGFGGATRTPSELYWAFESSLSLRAIDLFWKLALPVDAQRSHPACHVFPKLEEMVELKVALPDTLLVIGGRDPLQDWEKLYYDTQQRSCTNIRLLMYDDAIHGFNMNPSNLWTAPFLLELGRFIGSSEAVSTASA